MNDRNLVSTIAENVISNDLVSELQAFLNDFGIRERLTARETPSGDIALYFEKSRLIPFVENCSSGTVALLRLFNYFHATSVPSLLFVDEFDAFYHHDLAEKVVDYFKSQTGRQVLWHLIIRTCSAIKSLGQTVYSFFRITILFPQPMQQIGN